MPALHNLASRKGNGIFVTLDYNADTEQVEVHVHNSSDDFILYPPNCKALDCYHHPYAYAERVLLRGTFAEVS